MGRNLRLKTINVIIPRHVHILKDNFLKVEPQGVIFSAGEDLPFKITAHVSCQ